METLEKIVKIEDDDLTELVAPNATKIEVWHCHAMTNIKSPKATEIDVWFCDTLTSIDAPNAKEIDVLRCPLYEQKQ